MSDSLAHVLSVCLVIFVFFIPQIDSDEGSTSQAHSKYSFIEHIDSFSGTFQIFLYI